MPPSTVGIATEVNVLALCDAVALVSRIPSGAVDLCYIDPPLFPSTDGVTEQNRARVYRDHLSGLANLFQHVRRTLSTTGNFLVHSEPEMNGSIRLLLDQVFGRDGFRQEIIVPRPVPRSRHGLTSSHDTVFHFSCGPDFFYEPPTRELTQEEIARQFRNSDDRGPYQAVSLFTPLQRPRLQYELQGITPPAGKSWRYSLEKLNNLMAEGKVILSPGSSPMLKQYLSESAQMEVGTLWYDLTIGVDREERVDYPTQKPERLLDRIIRMGCREEGLVLDPFCGTGTSLVAANKIRRRWIGGDISPEAVRICTERLRNKCRLAPGDGYLSTTEDLLKSSFEPKPVALRRIATGFDDLKLGPIGRLVWGSPLVVEETREFEFKEVNSRRPLDTITNTADEYAVAFLNSEGGRLFWGVRNSDRVVVGVSLTYEDRDELRRKVTDKLKTIRPAIDLTSLRLELHPVENTPGNGDLFVVELVVPRVAVSEPYFTGGNEAFVRLDGVKHKLAGPELTDWIRRRLTNT